MRKDSSTSELVATKLPHITGSLIDKFNYLYLHFSLPMMDNQDSRERASRHTHSKGVVKQITQTWSVMGEAFDLESRYKVIDYLGIA